ncbi:PadR family transcriptional regulator [Microbacterium sp. YY-01]|uniref:PadR family transcriptional regulator n=1 Tax=Microbacterium sp. YY-01 TaxID=3421634 RepID=UPI003D173918
MSTPVFSHGDLRLYLLSLLNEQPRHGYGIIQALAERTGGTYTPSAGTVYPRLAKLEEEGLVTRTTEGRTTVYSITDTGRAELAAREDDLEGIEAELDDSVRRIADEVRKSVQEAMRSLRADLAGSGSGGSRSDAGSTAGAGAGAGSASQGAADGMPTAAQHPDARVRSRAELQRADAAITTFRTRLRTELRTHVARGGTLTADTVTELTTALDDIADRITRQLGGA